LKPGKEKSVRNRNPWIFSGAVDRVEEFERHLAVCPSCVNYLQTYRDTIALGKAAFEDPDGPAEEFAPEELVSAVLRARRGGNSYGE
jgi:anti-sigma factor RsiW